MPMDDPSRSDNAYMNEPQVMQVRVINRNTFAISDMFDGTEYFFEPNAPVSIPIDAAHHIFGWYPKWTDDDGHEHAPQPEEMRRHVQKRFGWNTPAYAGGQGDIFYDLLTIQPIVYRMVPVNAEDAEEEAQTSMPQTPIRKHVNKLMAAADRAAQNPI